MSIATFFSRSVPSDHRFYDRFDEVTQNLAVASEHLKKLVRSDDETEREALAEQLHDTEHQGDTLTHQIFAELNSTFVTPFDREDIHKLTSALDDVLVPALPGAADRQRPGRSGGWRACPRPV